jgi:hypothetical protein
MRFLGSKESLYTETIIVSDMKIEEFKYTGVKKDGSVKSGGAIETKGGFKVGHGNGCSLSGCNCSPSYWFRISTPLKKGVVKGVTLTFDSAKEAKDVLKAVNTIEYGGEVYAIGTLKA